MADDRENIPGLIRWLERLSSKFSPADGLMMTRVIKHLKVFYQMDLSGSYMKVPRCEDCQHWQPRESAIRSVAWIGNCAAHDEQNPDRKQVLLFVELPFDASRSKMKIVTEKSFGCTLWEKRKDAR